MGDPAFAALVRLDLRRLPGHLLRASVFTGAALLLAVVADRDDAETVSALFLGTSAYYLLWPPIVAMRDRMEGGLELLAGLPVSPGTVAKARLTGVAVAMLPVAAHLTTGILIASPILDLGLGWRSGVAIFGLTWGLATGAAGLGAGSILRWGVEAIGRWPTVVVSVAMLGVVFFGDRYEAAIVAAIRRILDRTGVVWASASATVIVATVALTFAHRLIAVGVERFQPERERARS